MDMLLEIAQTFVVTCRDVFPVLALIVGFQFIILRQPIPRLGQVAVGFGCVLIGLTLFLVGLDKALFPLGKIMAKQLSAPEFVFGSEMAPDNPEWRAYAWGIVTVPDLVREVIAPGRPPDDTNVYEIMTKPVITVPPDMDIRYVARLLYRVGVRRAPVEDRGELLGVISMSDLVLRKDVL